MSTHTSSFIEPAETRARFSRFMSDMYQAEVPLYGDLLDLVAEVNQEVLAEYPDVERHLQRTGEFERLAMERHGAIRLGTAAELATIRRLFAVMGMQPVGYYDLSPAGVPVHSTAFRAIHEKDLQNSPFRVFTSLLRLELIDDPALRKMASDILTKRNIFTPRIMELIEQHEAEGGLSKADSNEFIQEALETFRWHKEATVTSAEYDRLHEQHRLIADVVAFKGPHINHLTPRTLDIDRIQAEMPKRGIKPKAVVEGPPRRKCPILLRQTSFKALQEKVAFTDQYNGSHTARFGEIEQRGAALTPKGRALYDQLLADTRKELNALPSEENAERYTELLEQQFKAFPDSHAAMHDQQLAYFRYFVTRKGLNAAAEKALPDTLDEQVAAGFVDYEPLVYEDFLPVSAAGIFQSNLGDTAQAHYDASSSQAEFENALGQPVMNEMALYAETQQRSIDECLAILKN